MNILFAGLGKMGLPMIKNLKKSPHNIYCFDVIEKNINKAKEYGALSYKDIIGEFDTFITMVPDSQSLLEFYQSEIGPFQQKQKSLLIDCSTIGPINAKNIFNEASDMGHIFVDAPVSGGVAGAENGSLTFMVGAQSDQIYKDVQGILQYMGKNCFNCGNPGMGQTAKLANNLALAIQMRSVTEAMNLGISLGMNGQKLALILETCTSNCWSLKISNPVPGVNPNAPAAKEYENGFACGLIKKDLNLALESSNQLCLSMDFTKMAHKSYQEMCEKGLSSKDFGIVYQEVTKNNKK